MKIAVLSSHTGSLFWFRMDMMKEFIKQGHFVIALGPENEEVWGRQFKDNGIEYRQFFVERNGINPFKDFKTCKDLYSFMRKEKPDKVFTYQAKTVIYGSLAAKFNGIKEVYPLIAGLGSVFRGNGLRNKIFKKIMKIEYKVACNASKKIFFQNHDDVQEFINNRLVDVGKTIIINGSGVNIEKFAPRPLPEKPAFLFIGRLIKDKGLIEYLEACRKIKDKYPYVRCMLVGPYDSNPSAVKPQELEKYITNEVIEYFGEQSDVRNFISNCTAYVLPSYHEGTPKTVIEAMAMGRAIITSNAPGCRETVKDGENGYLVAVKDINGIAEKMEFLILNPNVCVRMGNKSLNIAKEKYDVKIVNQSIMKTMGLI